MFARSLMLALGLALSLVSGVSLGHGENVVDSFPITGAYTATQIDVLDRVPVIQFAGNYDKTLVGGQSNYEARATVSQEFFRHQPDEYDFLVTFTTFEFETGDAQAFYLGVRNDTKGIGLPLFDNSDLFGSNGKLQGYIDMAALSRYKLDPTHPEFERVLDVLAHEVWHRWGAFVHFQDQNGESSDQLRGKDEAHWSYLLDTQGSVGYGARWRENSDGTFTAVTTRKTYSPLDLYLMGFNSAKEVPPFFLIENPDISRFDIPRTNDKVSGTKKLVTVDQVIAAEGPRIPASSGSQKDFRLGFALITGPGQEPTQAQLNAINAVREGFQTRFSILTGGRGVSHVFPEASPTEFVGEPGEVSNEEGRAESFDLDQAVGWLRSQQSGAGHWTDKETTRLRDTVVALEVLREQDAGFVGAPLALQWLDSRQEANTDYLARRARLSGILAADSTELLEQLYALQNADGGWGVAKGFHSSALDTALVLTAMAKAGVGSSSASSKGVEYLLSAQNTDGGWGNAVGSESRVNVTTFVVNALLSSDRSAAVSSALTWLASVQHPDGGFGDGGSNAHDTAATFEAFIDANATDLMRASAASNFLMQSQLANGSWGDSVYATALAVSALKNFSFHNWSLRSFVATPAEPNDGDRVRLDVVVQNDSNVSTPPTTVRLIEIDSSGSTQAIGHDINLPIMPARTALALSPYWATKDKAGIHTLKVQVDPDKHHVEMTRADNGAEIVVEVRPAHKGIDLAVYETDVLVNPAIPSELPAQLAISASIHNVGMTAAKDVEVILRDPTLDANDILERSTIAINGRSSGVVNFVHKLTKPGVKDLVIEVDPASLIEDANRDNNLATVSVETSPSVDLEVLTTDLHMSSSQVYVGDDVTLTAVIRNKGTLEVPASTVRYSLNDGSSSQELRLNTPALAAGSEQTQQLTWLADRPGSLSFLVEMDPSGVIPETDDSNNSALIAFSAVTADGPNISVNYRNFHVSPDPLLEHGSANLTVAVTNSGTQAAENVPVKFYVGNPDTDGEQLGDTQLIGRIEAGATVQAGVTWDKVPDPGEKLLYVIVDPEGSIPDPNIGDNITFTRVNALSVADLAVGSGDVILQPASPKAGEAVALKVSVSNLGQQPAHQVRVRAFEGDPGDGVVLGEDQVIPLLEPAGVASTDFSWTSHNTQGAKTITIVVDPDSHVNERHRENNTASRSFILQNSDYFVTERYFSPDGDSVKDSTEFTFRLAEPTDVDVVIVDVRGRERQRFTGETLVGSIAGRQLWDGLDSLGRLVPDGSYKFQVINRVSQELLGEAPVEIDTNRSSLFKALKTPYELYRNLTCDLPHIEDFAVADDEDAAFFRIADNYRAANPYDRGIYRMNANGGELRQLIPLGHFSSRAYPQEMVSSRDGSKIMFEVYDPSRQHGSTDYTFWSMDSSGKGLKKIDLPADTRLLGANITGSRFFAVHKEWSSNPKILAVSTIDGAIINLFQGVAEIRNVTLGDSGRKIGFSSAGQGQASVHVLDTETSFLKSFAAGESYWNVKFELSPNESRLAVYDSQIKAMSVFELSGKQVGLFRLPDSLSPEEVDHISWSADSTEFAFYVRGTVSSGYGYGEFSASSEGYGSGSSGEDRGGVFVATIGDGSLRRVLQFTNTGGDYSMESFMPLPAPESSVSEYGYVVWSPGDRTLLYHHQSGAHVIFLDEDDRAEPAFEDWDTELESLRFVRSGRKLIIDRYQQNNAPCRTGKQLWTFQSLLNLTADLRAVRSVTAGGIILRGTASDLNFERYQLEYASHSAPELWRPIAPTEVTDSIDETFTMWAPPAPGRYLVRLTVTDKAGNQKQTVRSASWSQQLSITDISRQPAFFSPNGDNVQDDTLMAYRVLQPVQVEMRVFNVDGKQIRSISKQHPEAGEFQLTWDGRDDMGRIAADGLYRIAFNQFDFYVTLDNTPPAVGAHLFDAYQISARAFIKDCKKLVNVAPGLSFDMSGEQLYAEEPCDQNESIAVPRTPLATDVNLIDFKVEQGNAISGNWREDYSLENLTRLAGSQFRVTATDKAGNVSVAISKQAKEELIVLGIGDLGLATPLEAILVKSGARDSEGVDWMTFMEFQDAAYEVGLWKPPARLKYYPMTTVSTSSPVNVLTNRYGVIKIAQATVSQIAGLQVSYREGPDEDWKAAPVLGTLDAWVGEAIQYHFDEFLPVDPNFSRGTSHVVIDTSFLKSDVRYDFRLISADVAGRIHTSNMFPVMHRQPAAFMGIVGPLDEAMVELFMTKPLEDNETLLWGKHSLSDRFVKADLFITSSEDPRYTQARLASTVPFPAETIPFPVADLRACQRYVGKMVLYAEGEAPGSFREVVREEAPFQMSCLKLEADVEPVTADSCGIAPPGLTKVRLTGYGRALKLLTLGREGEVIFNVNAPVSWQPYSFEIDTKALDEGEHLYDAVLTNVDDQQTTIPVTIVVDRTPPTAQITYPLEGQKVCGVPRALDPREPSVLTPVVDAEGILSDDRGLKYKIDFRKEGSGVIEPLKHPGGRATVKSLFGTLSDPDNPAYGFSGWAQAYLQVIDDGGHLVCASADFEFDGGAEASLTLSHRLFAPTGNGSFDELEISSQFFEPGERTLSVHLTTMNERGDRIAGAQIRSLGTRLPSAEGAHSDVWDGRNDAGQVMPDGVYAVNLTFTDGCGNTAQHVDFVTVDTTPPLLNIAYPSASSPLTMILEVTGSVQDAHLDQYRLEVASLDATAASNRILLNGGSVNKNGLLGIWNTNGIAGNHELRLTAVDRVGNASEIIVPLALTERVNLLDYVEAAPRLFSPNNDGRMDTTSLRIGLGQPSSLTVKLLKEDVATRVLADAQPYSAGAVTLPWDGLGAQGHALPDGEYHFEVTAALTSDPAVKQTEIVTVIIDTLSPEVVMSKPAEGVTRSAGSIIGSVQDLHLEEYQLELSSPGTQWVELATGHESVARAVLGEFPDIEDGVHSLRIMARDQAANQSEYRLELVVDNAAPIIEITAPEDGSVVGQVGGQFDITGTVEDEHLRLYGLSIGVGTNPSTWTNRAEGTELPAGGLVVPFDPAAYADGSYSIRLQAEDLADHVTEKRIRLVVDNTLPVAALSTPLANSYVTESTTIVGTATDSNLLQYRLDIAPGQDLNTDLWSELGLGDASVLGAELLPFDSLPPDGPYLLRLEVTDAAGNQSSTIQPFTVDTQPPSPPVGLAAQLGEDRQGLIQWQPNIEPDLAGYHFYRDGVQQTAELLSGTVANDPSLADGRYVYTVTAVDHAGWESEHSDPFELVVDTTPPTTSIFSPQADSRVHGLVDIKGTANSYDDFKEYRLYIGEGSEPQHWQLIRRSPVAIIADALGHWDTYGLAEDAVFSIRLEAEDINGNTADMQVAVRIDNLPPASPQGLAADVSEADASLSWDANSEDDLLGYLLFRNGRLVNVLGALVGDMRPYALLETNFPDLGLADGKHRYAIAAIDFAGNLSELSEELEIEIDMRAPQAAITLPLAGHAFEDRVFVSAVSEDTDVATVQFQYRTDGAEWLNMGSADSSAPWETVFAPADHSLGFGILDLRAIATDHGGLVDPDPLWITIDFRDVTAPDQVLNLFGKLNGGQISLGWTASDVKDLAGYFVERIAGDGEFERLTADPLSSAEFVDADLDDGVYSYRVIAVDLTGNESDPSNIYQTHVYTPVVAQPRTPQQTSVQTLTGKGLAQTASVWATRHSAVGAVDIGMIETNAQGEFVLEALPLEPGLNVIAVYLEDEKGDRSKLVKVPLVVAKAPSPPTGLLAQQDLDYEVQLSWNENAEVDIAGYRPYRDALPLFQSEAVVPTSVEASSFSWYSLNSVLDGSGGWFPEGANDTEWLAVTLAEPHWIDSIKLSWWYPAATYTVEAWSAAAGAWVPLDVVAGDTEQVHHVAFEQPYYADKFRIALQGSTYGELRQFELSATPLVSGLSLTDLHTGEESSGSYQYSLSAVNIHGFESQPGEALQVDVGDTAAPAPVTLTATASGSDVVLTWSESPTAHHYELMRNGSLVAELNAGTLSYRDQDLLNDTYGYVVIARRHVRVRSEPSNQVVVSINEQVPGAPLDLTVDAPETGSSLQLQWRAADGSAPDFEYEIHRSLTSGGPYEFVGYTDATRWLDQPLENGRRYFYVVTALDFAGNAGALSNQAEGVPQRLLIDAPVISYPTASNRPFLSKEPSTVIAGLAEPGSRVSVFQDGFRLRWVDASQGGDAGVVERNNFDARNSLSPNGRYLALHNYDGLQMHDYQTGTTRSLANYQGDTSSVAQWLSDNEIVYVEIDSNSNHLVRKFNIASNSATTLGSVDGWSSSLTVSPDQRKLAIVANKDGENGIWAMDTQARQWEKVHDVGYSIWNIDDLGWSTDGRHLTFSDSSTSPAKLVVLDSQAGTLRSVSQHGVGNLSWDADGKGFVFDAYDAGWYRQLNRFSIEDGSVRQITHGNVGYSYPVLLPDGRLAAVVGGQRFSVIDDAGEESETLFNAGVWLEHAQFSPGGYVKLSDYYRSWRVELPGRFEMPGIVLNPGDNLFSAVARNQAEVESQLAKPVSVSYSTEGRADLTIQVEDITVLPGVPRQGEQARVSLRIRNTGDEPSLATIVNLTAVAPGGTAQDLMTNRAFAALSPGQSRTISVTWTVPRQAGDYLLAAVIDPYDGLKEVSKANNVALRDLVVASDAAPALSGSLNGSVYAADEEVLITSGISNAGVPFTGLFEVLIQDAQGYPVASVSKTAINGLGYGQSEYRADTWPAIGVFSGDYRAILRLSDQSGHIVAERPLSFAIAEEGELSARVTTDDSSYGDNQPVTVSGSYQLLKANSPMSEVQLSISIKNGDGELLIDDQRSLGTVLPGSSGEVSLLWNTGNHPPGDYLARLELVKGAAVLASAETWFAVEVGRADLQGSLLQQWETVAAGSEHHVSYQVNNIGNRDIDKLDIEVQLFDPLERRVLHASQQTIAMEAGQDYQGQASLPTEGLLLRSYHVRLRATSSEPSVDRLLANMDFLVVDAMGPRVEVHQPVMNSQHRGLVEGVAFAVDALSTVVSVELQLDGGPWISAASYDPSGSLYRGTFPSLLDGEHVMQARARDAAGNMALSIPTTFIVDNTAPVITISEVEDEGAYAAGATPVVTVADPNLQQSQITLNGTPFVSGTPVHGEGRYQLIVYARDLAGNETKRSLWFSLLSAPRISITGVQDGALYNHPVTPLIDVVGADETTILLNGQPYLTGSELSVDGVYELVVTAENAAGLTAASRAEFKLDSTAPVVSFISPQADTEVQQPSTDIIGETEADAEVTLTKEGYQAQALADAAGIFRISNAPLSVGNNQFSAFARDRAGNLGRPSILNVVRLKEQTVELTGEVGHSARVLVWVPGASADGGASGRQQQLLNLLRESMNAGDFDYHIAHGEVDFRSALRTGRYNVVVLGELHKAGAAGNHFHLSQSMRLELQASVAAGTGLIWIKTHPDKNEHWQLLFGAKPNGAFPRAAQVTLPDSPATNPGTWAHQGFITRLKATGGVPVGGFSNGGDAAMVLHSYGAGPTLAMAFEPNNLNDSSSARAIVRRVLEYAATGIYQHQPNGVAELSWRATGMTGDGLTLDTEMHGPTILHVWGGVLDSPTTAHWELPGGEDEITVKALVRLPSEPGNYLAEAKVMQRSGVSREELAAHTLTLPVTRSPDVLAADLVGEVMALPIVGNKQAQQRQRVVNAINAAVGIAPVSASAAESCMAHLREALEQLDGLPMDARQARAALGYLMQAYQLQWTKHHTAGN